jgi:polysaccharide export outer membrane protein
MINRFFLFILLSVLLYSCVPQRKIVYVQSPKDTPEFNHNWSSNKKSIKIDAFDLLHIKINTIDQPEYNFFGQENTNASVTEQSLSITSYSVDESGYVSLPIIGKVKVKDLTLEEAATAIKDALKNIMNNPIVSVRFVNNSITILGEVLRAGTYAYTTEQISIFKAIGLAGDITEYGNRKNVVLIRENGKQIHKYYLDLTKDDLFKSEYYFLQPNDVVYIEPLKLRRYGMKEIPYALIISAINAAFVALVYFQLGR